MESTPRVLEATVRSLPSLEEQLSYPHVIAGIERFVMSPGVATSSFASEWVHQRATANLGLSSIRRWLQETFAVRDEVVVDTVTTDLEVMYIDLHVPSVAGAQGHVELGHESTSEGSFVITLLGSGGGRDQVISIGESETLEATSCTREVYKATAQWQLVEVRGGPDAGTRYLRLESISLSVIASKTHSIPGRHCGSHEPSDRLIDRTWDLREGAVASKEVVLTLRREDGWTGKAGLTLAQVGLDASVETRVTRARALDFSYELPGGRRYEAFRSESEPFWQWGTS